MRSSNGVKELSLLRSVKWVVKLWNTRAISLSLAFHDWLLLPSSLCRPSHQKLTDVFEGSLIRTFRRLQELIRQMMSAAKAIGNGELEEKFTKSLAKLERENSIIFSPWVQFDLHFSSIHCFGSLISFPTVYWPNLRLSLLCLLFLQILVPLKLYVFIPMFPMLQ